MARGKPRVLAGVLTITDVEGGPEGIAVGSAAWYAWLADDAHESFVFTAPTGTFSARKERRQRGGVYWTAHRRRAGKLRKAYLGKSEDLTAQRLETIAAQLAAEGRREGDASRVVPPTPAADLLTTKLHVPRPRPGLVARPRLMDRLTQALAGPLTVIAAPAGFGKTTLLAAWVRETGRRLAWVSLDGQDADPSRFWTYVVAALQTLDPRVGAGALGLLRAPQPASLQAVLVALINEVASTADPFVLVLDDYHLVDRPPISETLGFLVEHLPEPLHLVLVARSDPHLPLARWRADGRLRELRAADLRFTPDEAAAFLNREMGLGLAAEELATLGARTEGWIAGLQLAALSLQTSGDRPGFVAGFGGSHRFVLDYLTEQVLQGQPARVRDFLLKTAILERMCAPLCDALTGDADGQAALERLERDNLFVVPLDDERRWYRYHHLFAEVLRHRLRLAGPDRLAEQHRRASGWYEAAGYPADAIEHALAAADLAGAARLVERNVDAAWMRGEIATAEGWLAALPEETVRARPPLLAARVWLRYLVQQRHAEASAELGRLAEALAGTVSAAPATGGPADSRVADERRALRGIIAAMRTAVEGAGGPVDVPIAYGREALANLTDGHPLWRTVAGAVLGRAYTVAGDLPAASRALDEAIELGRRSGTDYVVVVALDYLRLVRVAEGRLRAAFELGRRARDLARERGGAQWPHLGYVENGLAGLLYEWDDLVAAREHFEAAIRLGRLHAHGPVLVSA